MKQLKNRLEELKEEIKVMEEKLFEAELLAENIERIEYVYELLKELDNYIEEENIDSAFCIIEDIECELCILDWSI